MEGNYRDDYRIYSLRFGDVAVMMGFVTVFQMEEAFSEQISNYPSQDLDRTNS